jgi:hypothetical protein
MALFDKVFPKTGLGTSSSSRKQSSWLHMPSTSCLLTQALSVLLTLNLLVPDMSHVQVQGFGTCRNNFRCFNGGIERYGQSLIGPCRCICPDRFSGPRCQYKLEDKKRSMSTSLTDLADFIQQRLQAEQQQPITRDLLLEEEEEEEMREEAVRQALEAQQEEDEARQGLEAARRAEEAQDEVPLVLYESDADLLPMQRRTRRAGSWLHPKFFKR